MAEKQPYIRQRVIANVEESKKAREANNEGKGLSYREYKMSSKNFDRLMEERGVSKEEAQQVKSSFNRWAGDARDPNLSQEVTAKHSPPGGDKGYVYSTKGSDHPASGKYVAAEKLDHADEAKSRYAAPTVNKMTQREEVRVHGDQVRGAAAPQPGWTQEAKKSGDHVERKGGGTQIYTKGGYATKAVESQKGTKYDMKTSGSGKSQTDEFGVDMSKAQKSHSSSQEHSKKR